MDRGLSFREKNSLAKNFFPERGLECLKNLRKLTIKYFKLTRSKNKMISGVELLIFLTAGLIAFHVIGDSNLATMIIGVIAAIIIIQSINTTTTETLLMSALAVYALAFGLKPESLPSTETVGKSLKAVVLIIVIALALNMI